MIEEFLEEKNSECKFCDNGIVFCDSCKGSGNRKNSNLTNFQCNVCSGQGHYDCPYCK